MSYAVTRGCNAGIKHWRGKLRGYAVTRASCMCVGARAGVQARACTCEGV